MPNMPHPLQSLIELAWDSRASLDPTNSPEVRAAVEEVIAGLDTGTIRVAERQAVGEWTVNQWVKKAVLLSFRLNDNRPMHAGDLSFYDKVAPKFAGLSEAEMRATGVRVVPPAVARRGSFLARNVVLMPARRRRISPPSTPNACVGAKAICRSWPTITPSLVRG